MIFFLTVFAVWFFVFSIYEVKFEVVVKEDARKKKFEIAPKTLNLLGLEVPFRTIKANYIILEKDTDGIRVVKERNNCILKIDNNSGLKQISVLCSTKYNLFPEKINLSLK